MQTEPSFSKFTLFHLSALAVVLALDGPAAWAGGGPEFNQLGDILISDQFNQQVIVVDRNGTLDFSEGMIGVAGPESAGELNAPYDAKEIGVYLGLTPPFDEDFDGDRDR